MTAFLIVGGLVMVVAPTFVQRLFGLLLLSSSEAIVGFSEPAATYVVLVHAVMGAVMVGWGILIMFVLIGPFRRPSREAWLGLSFSLTAWFILDTAFSLLSGFWQNAALNSVVIFLYAIPLVALRAAYFRSDAPARGD